MLSSLTISNIVLIDKLALDGASGLTALTGETGAGKSILLDALGLALGARAESGLVRHGNDQASVTACFDLPQKHPALIALKEHDIETDDNLILRRTLGKDGRSKAFINDSPVSAQLLRDIGGMLVEIHGQFETQGLLDPQTHGIVLDAYAGLEAERLAKLWRLWKEAQDKLDAAALDAETAKMQEDYLSYALKELEDLDPQVGEERALVEKRALLSNRDKVRDSLDAAVNLLESEEGLQTLAGRLDAALSRSKIGLGEKAEVLMSAVARMTAEINDISYEIERLRAGGMDGGESLEEIEERYFALKDCAKKHRVSVDDLPNLREELAQKLRLATDKDAALADLARAADNAKKDFVAEAEKASALRKKATLKLAKAVNAELPALKLDKASFLVQCDALMSEAEWGPSGTDRVRFLVSTNPQTPPGPLHKIASGGELSRFMLALKLILAETGKAQTLIFDEVDSGLGGAAADAVGERLARLAQDYQILVITHSPQVAARAAHHWIVAKGGSKGALVTSVSPLQELKARQEEIARMLSGAKITAEARAAAAKLLEERAA